MVSDSRELISVRLFGTWQVECAGMELPKMRTDRERLLLAVLTLESGGIARNQVAGILWPEANLSNRASNLRRSLAGLRKALGGQSFRIPKQASRELKFELDGMDVDALQFDSLVSKADIHSLQQAVKLYRGPLLSEFNEDWVRQERSKRLKAYQKALRVLSENARQSDQREIAVDLMIQAVQADPVNQEYQCALMRLLMQGERYIEAARIYDELSSLLKKERNTKPSVEAIALYDQIRAALRNSLHRANVAPTPRVSEPPLVRLPIPPGPLIGRETSVEAIIKRLQNHRMVTLTGAGGVGKTRLAVYVAHEILHQYPAGVCFVKLGSTTTFPRMLYDIAAALNATAEPHRSTIHSLTAWLKDKSLLLILDNCEHQADTVAEMTRSLLEQCAGLQIIATSRQPLKTPGEAVFPVGPLTVPDVQLANLADSADVKGLGHFGAVELFITRVDEATGGFELTKENACTVVQICRRLHGIPLAIELAAARTRVLSLDELQSQLQASFSVLATDSTCVPERQRTLWNTVEWSVKLLSPAERSLLFALSIFKGSWSRAASESICDPGKCSNGTVLDVLDHLVAKSLVFVDDTTNPRRFFLLDMIQQFIEQSQSACDVDLTQLRERHAQFFLDLVDKITSRSSVGRELYMIDADVDNVEAALHWYQEHSIRPNASLKLAACLADYWYRRGDLLLGRQAIEKALRLAPPDLKTEARAQALNGAGRLAWLQGDYSKALAFQEDARAIYEHLEQKAGLANTLYQMGLIARHIADYPQGRSHFEQSLKLWRQIGDRKRVGQVLGSLGELAWFEGNYDHAQALQIESLEIARALRDKRAIAYSLTNLGSVSRAVGDLDRSLHYLLEAIQLFQQVGEKWGIGYTAWSLSCSFRCLGDLEQATRSVISAMAIALEVGNLWGMSFALESAAYLAVEQEAYETAAYLLAASGALRDRIGSPIPAFERKEYDHALQSVKVGLGETRFARAWRLGSSLSPDEAAGLVRGESL